MMGLDLGKGQVARYAIYFPLGNIMYMVTVFWASKNVSSLILPRKGKLFQATGENIEMSNAIFLWSCFIPGLFDLLPQLIGVDLSDS